MGFLSVKFSNSNQKQVQPGKSARRRVHTEHGRALRSLTDTKNKLADTDGTAEQTKIAHLPGLSATTKVLIGTGIRGPYAQNGNGASTRGKVRRKAPKKRVLLERLTIGLQTRLEEGQTNA